MKYLWIFVVLAATSAFGQNAYGPDFLNLHCTTVDTNSVPTFGVAPKPGFAPNGSTIGSATIYCDAPSSSLKISFSNSAFATLGGGSPVTFFGNCGGTAGSNITTSVGNLGLAQNTAGTCASVISPTVATNSGNVTITHSCNLKNLTATSTAAGVNASDSVVTIYLQTVLVSTYSATALTCTMGTALTCNDPTHTVSVSQGNRIEVAIVTQTGSTAANYSVSVDCQ